MDINIMDQLIFSKAYYTVIDFNKILEFFTELNKKGDFILEEFNNDKKTLIGAFVRDYPENHWNPLSQKEGAKQVLGHIFIENNLLKVETMSKNRLVEARNIIDHFLKESIRFEKAEYKNPLRR